MNLPIILFGILISTLYGAIFHFLLRGDGRRLFRYLFFSLTGFWIGHLIGSAFSLNFLHLGPLHLGVATIGSAIILFLGHWLSLIETEEYEINQ